MGVTQSKEKTILPDATFTNHEADITCLALSDDQSMIATGSDDYSIRIWTTRENSEECTGILLGHTDYVTSMKIHDEYIMSGSADTTMRKWDLTTCECTHVYEGHSRRISKIICSDEYIFSASLDSTAKLWYFDTNDKEEKYGMDDCIKTFVGHSKSILCLIFVPERNSIGVDRPGIWEGDALYTGSSDCKAMSWSLVNAQYQTCFKGHKEPISAMVIGPDLQNLFTASSDKTIRMWNIHTGDCKMVLEDHHDAVLCMLLVGDLLFSGDSCGEVHCRSRKTGEVAQTFKGHMDSVVAMTFDRGSLYTVSSDKYARVFDAASGDLKYVFRGHSKAVTGLVIVRDTMFTTSNDSTLRRWKLEKPKPEDESTDESDFESNGSNSYSDSD